MRGNLLGLGIRILGHTQYLGQSRKIQTSRRLLDCAEWISPASDWNELLRPGAAATSFVLSAPRRLPVRRFPDRGQAGSTNICVPASLGQEVGAALGMQAGEERLGEVIRAGGFATVRRVVATPFNMVLEARA